MTFPCAYDNSRMKEVLEIEPRDVQQSILDTAYSMIELGVVKKSKKMKKQEMSTEGESQVNGEVNGEKADEEKEEKEGGEEPKENSKEVPEKKEEPEQPAVAVTKKVDEVITATEEKPKELDSEDKLEKLNGDTTEPPPPVEVAAN